MSRKSYSNCYTQPARIAFSERKSGTFTSSDVLLPIPVDVQKAALKRSGPPVDSLRLKTVLALTEASQDIS